MFQYSGGGTGVPSVPTGDSPRYETVYISIRGSLAAIQAMLKTFHKLGYADPNAWGKPQRTQLEGEWVTVLIQRVRVD